MKTLQLELEYIYAALEDEALDVAQGTQDAGFLLSRQAYFHPLSCVLMIPDNKGHLAARLWNIPSHHTTPGKPFFMPP